MSFVINAKGERVEVDMEVDRFSQTCVLYADDTDLEEYYILNLYKVNHMGVPNVEPELVKQIEKRKLPTKDEIMYDMWKNGLSRYDIATIEKGFRLDWADN